MFATSLFIGTGMESQKLLFIILLMVTCTIFKAGEFAEILDYFGTVSHFIHYVTKPSFYETI